MGLYKLDAMSKNYKEQYLSPKWQKKRLEILERDNFECRICCTSDEKLNVHHNFYIFQRDIWDYDNRYLITLCDDCHIRTHEHLENLYSNLSKLHFSDLLDLCYKDFTE